MNRRSAQVLGGKQKFLLEQIYLNKNHFLEGEKNETLRKIFIWFLKKRRYK